MEPAWNGTVQATIIFLHANDWAMALSLVHPPYLGIVWNFIESACNQTWPTKMSKKHVFNTRKNIFNWDPSWRHFALRCHNSSYAKCRITLETSSTSHFTVCLSWITLETSSTSHMVAFCAYPTVRAAQPNDENMTPKCVQNCIVRSKPRKYEMPRNRSWNASICIILCTGHSYQLHAHLIWAPHLENPSKFHNLYDSPKIWFHESDLGVACIFHNGFSGAYGRFPHMHMH